MAPLHPRLQRLYRRDHVTPVSFVASSRFLMQAHRIAAYGIVASVRLGSTIQKNPFIYALWLLVTLSSCQQTPGFDEANWQKEHATWREERRAELLGERGWAKVSGMDWLEQGSYRIGSARDNDIILAAGSAPAYVGTISLLEAQGTLESDSTMVVQFTAHPDAEIWQDSSRVQAMTMLPDYTGDQTILRTGSVQLGIIRRGGKLALRTWDDQAESFTGFHDIPSYPLEAAWIVKGIFKRHKTPKSIDLLNIIGITEANPSDGYLEFEWQGSTYTLDVVAKPSDTELFVIFGDPTNLKETYGAGRYLYVDRADTLASETPVILDFNKAYNPPCAFTAYATCPLPPDQNKLPFKVTAGEKRYH